jgi:hypothetical protein
MSTELAPTEKPANALSTVRSLLEGTRTFAGHVVSPAHAPLTIQCVSLLCYFVAARLMMLDPWFTGESFYWNQSSILVLLGILMVMAMAFEWHLLGVSRGFNLVVQVALAYPFMIFLARLLGRPWNYTGNTSWAGQAVTLLMSAADLLTGLLKMIPTWITDAFKSPGTMLVLLSFCLVTSICKTASTRIAGVVAMLLVPVAVMFSGSTMPSRWFVLGAVLMGFGAVLQYRDVHKHYRDKTILERFRNLKDEVARRASLRLVRRAWEDGRISEGAAEGLVRQAYEDVPGLESADIRDTTRSLVADLVTTYGVLDIRHNKDGIFLVPPANAELDDDALTQAARFPRVTIVFVLAVLWVCMPFDMFPDAIPLVGAIDDVVMMSLATSQLGQLVGRRVTAQRALTAQ